LAAAITNTAFAAPRCPIYQNVDAQAATDIEIIKKNLIAQLTAPVRWTQSVQSMIGDGAAEFIECGPGKVLQGLVKKIASEVSTSGVSA
jgi:[acyl-carrier-protein] S-malonyltransferase